MSIWELVEYLNEAAEKDPEDSNEAYPKVFATMYILSLVFLEMLVIGVVKFLLPRFRVTHAFAEPKKMVLAVRIAGFVAFVSISMLVSIGIPIFWHQLQFIQFAVRACWALYAAFYILELIHRPPSKITFPMFMHHVMASVCYCMNAEFWSINRLLALMGAGYVWSGPMCWAFLILSEIAGSVRTLKVVRMANLVILAICYLYLFIIQLMMVAAQFGIHEDYVLGGFYIICFSAWDAQDMVLFKYFLRIDCVKLFKKQQQHQPAPEENVSSCEKDTSSSEKEETLPITSPVAKIHKKIGKSDGIMRDISYASGSSFASSISVVTTATIKSIASISTQFLLASRLSCFDEEDELDTVDIDTGEKV